MVVLCILWVQIQKLHYVNSENNITTKLLQNFENFAHYAKRHNTRFSQPITVLMFCSVVVDNNLEIHG